MAASINDNLMKDEPDGPVAQLPEIPAPHQRDLPVHCLGQRRGTVRFGQSQVQVFKTIRPHPVLTWQRVHIRLVIAHVHEILGAWMTRAVPKQDPLAPCSERLL